GDGITGVNQSDGSYGYYTQNGITKDIVEEQLVYDDASGHYILTISPLSSGFFMDIVLNSVVFSTNPSTYTLEYSIDSDGEGTAYTERNRSEDFTIANVN